MNSTKIISVISLFMLVSIAAGCKSNSVLGKADLEKNTAPPNIIFLMTDDQRWDNMGCYGKPEFNTPNIDKVAAQGVTFDKAFYAVAICMPSRVTTGRLYLVPSGFYKKLPGHS